MKYDLISKKIKGEYQNVWISMLGVWSYLETRFNLFLDGNKIGVLILFVQGDTVESKKNKKGRKIYRCKARINIPTKLLIAAIR